MKLLHPRVRYLGDHRYEFIEAAHGDLDFRVVSDRGYASESLTEHAAALWAGRFTATRAAYNGEVFSVESRIAGVTVWSPVKSTEKGGAA